MIMKIRTAILGYGRNGGTMHAGAIEKNDAFELTRVLDAIRTSSEEDWVVNL